MLSPLIDRLKTLILLTDVEVRKNVSLLLGEESEKEVHFPDRENWNTSYHRWWAVGTIRWQKINDDSLSIYYVCALARSIGLVPLALHRLIVSGEEGESDRDMLFDYFRLKYFENNVTVRRILLLIDVEHSHS